MKRAVEVAYVVAAALVAGWAFHDPGRGGFDPWELAALVMTLPAAIPGSVILLFVGAWVFALSDTQQGTDWPVTVVYGLLFGTFAVVNLVVLHLAFHRPAAVASYRTPS